MNGPNVNKKYRKLASSDVQITEFLFGNELKASLAAIDSASKLGRDFTQSQRGRTFFPPNQSKKRGMERERAWNRKRPELDQRQNDERPRVQQAPRLATETNMTLSVPRLKKTDPVSKQVST